MAGRLSGMEYVDALHRDGETMLVAADGMLDMPVPACAGWRVRDVVGHVGAVYGHKVAALRLGRQPSPGDWMLWPNDEVPADDVIDWCHGLLHDLANELRHGASSDPCWTWWESDQTRGFWQRRMALETAVHRTDVESAVGESPVVAPDLAVDGIDEVLTLMLVDSGFDATSSVVTAGETVITTIGPLRVTGSASNSLLWLWGRVGDEAVSIDGTSTERATIRASLYRATQ